MADVTRFLILLLIEAAASNGGGKVYYPAGNYLNFSIRLRSNITLILDNGADLFAAVAVEGQAGYDPLEPWLHR
jgi:polygalacturonase